MKFNTTQKEVAFVLAVIAVIYYMHRKTSGWSQWERDQYNNRHGRH